jgi:hypothetical protein
VTVADGVADDVAVGNAVAVVEGVSVGCAVAVAVAVGVAVAVEDAVLVPVGVGASGVGSTVGLTPYFCAITAHFYSKKTVTGGFYPSEAVSGRRERAKVSQIGYHRDVTTKLL